MFSHQPARKTMLRHFSLRPLAATMIAAACLIATSARAEDIDIYGAGTNDASLPNILFFMDNTSNWSANSQAWSGSSVYAKAKTMCASPCTREMLAEAEGLIEAIFYYGIPPASQGGKKRPWDAGFSASKDDVSLKQGQVEMRTLRLVLTRFVCTTSTKSPLSLKIGLMFFNDLGSVRSNGDRPGYMRRAIKKLTMNPPTDANGVVLTDANGKALPSSCETFVKDLTFIDDNITNPEFKGPANADYGSALFEAFKYFGGYTNPELMSSDTPGAPTGAQGYGPARFSIVNPLEDPDAFVDPGTKTTYKSPFDPAGCAKSYLVFVGNGYPNAEPGGPASFLGLNYRPPTLTADPNRYADEWIQFLATTDVNPAFGIQQVKTYAFDIFNDKPSASQSRLLQSMGDVGGIETGGYVKVDGDLSALFKAFSDLVINVASVDSVFTATTLPVSTTTQGSYKNQLFIGMFRPDGAAKPRWVGNLKQYKLGLVDNGEVRLVDSTGNTALGPTGFFSPQALSYWTEDSKYFYNHDAESPSDAPDGPIVEKGGTAQQLRNENLLDSASRKLYTRPGVGAALSSAPFLNTTSIVKGAFDDASINWIRGENNVESGSGAEYSGAYEKSGEIVSLDNRGVRPSVHGDILHSRPVAVNYGDGRVVVYYGSNDGVLRAVDGSQAGATAGHELWSFIAPDHFPMLKRQRENTPALFLPSTDASGNTTTPFADAEKKDYAFDGPIGLYATYSANSTLTKGKIYAAMRRGGHAVYAFNITNPTAPVYEWMVSNKTAGFEALGQTWSMPRPVVFAGMSSPYIIMGGGYDPAEDTNTVNTDTTKRIGNRVYVIDSSNGSMLRALQTDYAVASDVTVVDTNGDKVYDRAYVADVRGGLYRIGMTDSAGTLQPVSGWTITKIAELGGKVFHAPDVVVTKYYVSVLVGTGDREKPLMMTSNDRFFLVKDTLLHETDRAGLPLEVGDFSRVAKVNEASTEVVTFTDVNEDVNDAEGCYLELSTKGEKVVNAPFTIAGATYFGTNRPTPNVNTNSCTGNRGQARTYAFPLFCGAPKGVVLEGGGLPPSPVGGLVEMTVDGKTTLVPFIIGSGAGNSPFEAERPRPPITPSRKRNFWHINDNNR